MPVRVLHIINSLGLGGAQVSVKYLAENASEDIDIFIYPLRSKNIDIPIKAHIIKLPYRNYDPRKFFALLKIIKKHRIDILHAHLHKSIIGSLLATYFLPVKVIVHERGPIFRKGPQFCLYRWLLRLLHHRAAVIIANSHATARRLNQKAKIENQRIRVIPNAVDLAKFDPDSDVRERLRTQLELSPGDIVLGFVGRLHHVKGVDLLLEAMAILLQKSPRYLLALIGEGPRRSALETQARQLGIAERVRFLGFRDDIPQVMQAFDFGLVPSRQEPFGIVALEFMRAKIPLICSGVDGLADFVTHEKTALIPQNNSPEQIVACIERLTCDRELTKKLTGTAFEATENFGVSSHVKTIENIYHELLAKEAPR